MGLDRLHFRERQEKLPFAAESLEGRVVHRADRHRQQAKLVGGAQLQPLEIERADDHLLDGVVGQHFRTQQREPIAGQRADGVFLERADGFGPDAAVGDSGHRALGHGIGDPWFRQHVNPMCPPLGQFGQASVAQRGGHGPLDHAIGQQLARNALHLGPIEIALDQVSAGGGDGQFVGQL